MLWCQYCYWTTKDINIVADKSDDLIETLNKMSSNWRGNEEKIYNLSQGLIKDIAS
jgi:hypothetical protein